MELGKRIEKYLAQRPHSRHEIETYLSFRVRLGPNEVKDWIDKIEQLGFIDDDFFCDWWINSRLHGKNYGLEKIRSELLGKGIDRKLVAGQIARLDSDPEVNSLLENKIMEAYIKFGSPKETEIKNKFVQKLARKGFRLERILKVVYN